MCDGTYWNPCDCERETVGLLLLTVIDHQRIQYQECQEGKNRVQRSGWVYQFSVVALRNCHKLGAQNNRTFFFPCRRSQRHPLQYSCLENPMDGGAWWASVPGVTKSRTRLSDFTFTFHLHALEKEMATHSSVLAWRIPGRGEPGGLPSMGSHRVGHDWSDLAAAAAAAVLEVKV